MSEPKNTSTESDFDEEFAIFFTNISPLWNITENILIVYSIMVIILGNIFNTINFACFNRMKKRNSQNIYLSALSLAELFNINVNILLPMLRIKISKINSILEKSSFLCKLDGYFVEVGLLLPVWIMVAVTGERFVSVSWPLRKNIFCTPRHARILLSILTAVICAFCLFKLDTAGIENKSTFHYHTCRNVTNAHLVNMSTVLWALVPEIATFVLNVLIIRTIKTTTHSHKKFYPTHHIRRANQATRVVIVLSIIFLALISPTGILIIVELILTNGTWPQNSQAVILMIARKYALILFETNMIVNFPIYFLTFKNFR
jgi:hypothetical protein